MSSIPGTARILKGALVTVSTDDPTPTVLPFQYNPSTLKRTLQPHTAGGETDERSSSVRFVGAPTQRIELEVFLDATSALDQGDSLAETYGILPQLAILELLVFPSAQQVLQNQQQLASGTIEVTPLTAPSTLFVWGPQRVLPVRLEQYNITEQLFDTQLNPIRATINLSMRVLTYTDVASDTTAYNQFMAYQQALSTLANLVPTASASVTGVNPSQF